VAGTLTAKHLTKQSAVSGVLAGKLQTGSVAFLVILLAQLDASQGGLALGAARALVVDRLAKLRAAEALVSILHSAGAARSEVAIDSLQEGGLGGRVGEVGRALGLASRIARSGREVCLLSALKGRDARLVAKTTGHALGVAERSIAATFIVACAVVGRVPLGSSCGILGSKNRAVCDVGVIAQVQIDTAVREVARLLLFNAALTVDGGAALVPLALSLGSAGAGGVDVVAEVLLAVAREVDGVPVASDHGGARR
jgi:hypothetical protein